MSAMMAYVQALRKAGIENADVFADALQAVLDEDARRRQEMASDVAETKKGVEAILHRLEIADLKLDGRLKDIETSLRAEMKGMAHDIKEGDSNLRAEIKGTALDLAKTMNGQTNRTIAIISGIVGLIILAVKFGNGLLP